MRTHKVISKQQGKEFPVMYKHYRDFALDNAMQKSMMGKEYGKRFRKKGERGRIRMQKIMREILRHADKDMLLGAKIDYKYFTMEMEKRATGRDMPTVQRGFMYIPVVKMGKGKRLTRLMLDVQPTLRYNMEIARVLKTNILENL